MSDGVQGALVVAAVAIVPLVVLMLTSFVKISVVLALLRNAIGAPDAPSGLVVMGVSLVLTFFVMAPVAIEMIDAAASSPAPVPGGGGLPDAPKGGGTQQGPASGTGTGGPAGDAKAGAPDPATLKQVDVDAAIRKVLPPQYHAQLDATERAIEPLRRFLAKHSSVRDRDTFVVTAHRMGRAADGHELWVLAPAFLASELRAAFAIAILLFVPFLVIDLVVGLGLASLGLSTTSPQTVALPLKLLLFVSVDGWRMLLDSLLQGYV